ncbi:MAG TPA: hypothetical protein VNI57_04690, partial [Candidatus Saccharimonadales bacterium]|nr:hypothetical protein [Candidatus Saccharimonadales bacterium]
GAGDEAREAAARAESKDVSALRDGLAPAFLLTGDEAHLDDEFNPEADLVLGPEKSVEHHIYAGLAALWSGRPSRAAEEMERAEEKLMTLDGSEADLSSWVQWVRIMRIRAYLAAGRIPEARSAADAARTAGKGRINGLLVYSAGLADLAAGDKQMAVLMTNRLTAAGLKFWRYLLSAQSALAAGDVGGAESALSLASQGIDIQTTVCPGISVEPYVLSAQARTLLALGRAPAAEHLLMRVIGLGGRGIFAPDILVPAWELVAEAREAQGNRAGAEEAWREILTRWGKGEETPLLQRARAALGVK